MNRSRGRHTEMGAIKDRPASQRGQIFHFNSCSFVLVLSSQYKPTKVAHPAYLSDVFAIYTYAPRKGQKTELADCYEK